MNKSELDQTPGFLEGIRDFASSAVNRLSNMPNSKIAMYGTAYGAAAVTAFFAPSEIAKNNQAEARTPVDRNDKMALVGTVTVKETIGKKNGDIDTSVGISRVRYDINPNDNNVPTNVFSAMNGSKNPSTTTYKDGKFNPLKVDFNVADSVGCGIPSRSSVSTKYNPRVRLKSEGRPIYKSIFNKKSFSTKINVMTENTTGNEDKDIEIIKTNPQHSPLSKLKRLKKLISPPRKKATRKFDVTMDQCYPIAEATNPDNDKHKAAGYEYVPPEEFRIEYQSKIKNRKNGVMNVAQIDGSFILVDMKIYSPEAYASAK